MAGEVGDQEEPDKGNSGNPLPISVLNYREKERGARVPLRNMGRLGREFNNVS